MKNNFYTYLSCCLLVFSNLLHAQQKGQSKPIKLNLVEPYVRGLPPNIYAHLQFVDDNGNGILEAEENAKLIIVITNKGDGPAQGLEISCTSNKFDPELKITPPEVIRKIKPSESREFEINFKAGHHVKSNEHIMNIEIREHFGYDMDPAKLVMSTLEYRPSKLVFAGMDIYDKGEGTSAIEPDGMLQAGEQIRAKIVIQNIGQNVALNSFYNVTTTDPNIYIPDPSGLVGDIKIGEVKEIWVTISPNKRVKESGNLPIFLTVSEAKNYGNIKEIKLPLALEKKVPKTEVLNVKADFEKLKNQVARIEYKSDKFSFNNKNVKNIESVPLAKTKRPKALGIIIGVENYTHFPKAPYAVNDANIMEKYFINTLGIEKENVRKYTDKDVTGLFFRKMFDPENGKLKDNIENGVTELFVYYSGHGVPERDGSEVYLCPQDAELTFLKEQGYSLNKFYDALNKLGAKNVTVILDACFSGGSRQSEAYASDNLTNTKALGIKVQPNTVKPWETNPNFRLFTSSSGEETSLGFDPSQSGLFTYFLCNALSGEADTNKDKKITDEELQNYLNNQVNELAKKMYGKPQTPAFYGKTGFTITEY